MVSRRRTDAVHRRLRVYSQADARGFAQNVAGRALNPPDGVRSVVG